MVVGTVLAGMDDTFEAMYAAGGRRSVPPETLLKSSVLMALYSIRSERILFVSRGFFCGVGARRTAPTVVGSSG